MATRARKSSPTSTPTTKPTNVPADPHAPGDPLKPLVRGNWIWAPLKQDWRVLIPEESVRQEYVLRLWQ